MLCGATSNLRANGGVNNEKGAGKAPFEKAQQMNLLATAHAIRSFKDPYRATKKYLDFQDYYYFQRGQGEVEGFAGEKNNQQNEKGAEK